MRKTVGLVLVALLALGCAERPVDQTEINPFDLEFGGYTTDDEAPAFGNAELQASVQGEVSVSDPVADALLLDDSLFGHTRAVFALRIVWGQLHLDTTNTTPTVWDGSLSIDTGRIGVLRVIRFEGGDHLVLPRTAPNVLDWVSTTTIHNDGLLLLIGMPLDVLFDSTAANTITFATPPLTFSFPARDLFFLDTVITVDDLGNAVMFNGFLFRRSLCARGWLEGEWTKSDTSRGGEFLGRWSTRHGELSGFLEGMYGFNSDGKPVFFGKYIDEAGKFEGRLRGVWGPNTGANSGGFFRGVFYDPLDRPAGRLHGHWKVDGPGTGHFQGVWKTKCPSWDRDRRWEHWEEDWWHPGWMDFEDVRGSM